MAHLLEYPTVLWDVWLHVEKEWNTEYTLHLPFPSAIHMFKCFVEWEWYIYIFFHFPTQNWHKTSIYHLGNTRIPLFYIVHELAAEDLVMFDYV